MKQITAIIILVLTIITFLSCSDSGVDSEFNSDRVYTWEVDTIAYPGSFQTSMETIWGDSENDLWIAGHNNTGRGKIFHYDGNEWNDVIPIPDNAYGFDTYTFTSSLSLDGETFLCGEAISLTNDTTSRFLSKSLILSHKNNVWGLSHLGEESTILLSISGKNHEKLYAAGWDLAFFSYENNKWLHKPLDLLVPQDYEVKSINSVLVDQNQDAYMIMYCHDPDPLLTHYFFLQEINNTWTKIDSFDINLEAKWGTKLWESPQGEIYSFNPGIYKYSNKHWKSIFNQNELINAMNGTGSNNIYAAGHGLFHFNGKEWYEYKELRFNYGLARDLLILDDHIFVLYSNSSASFVLKGKLNYREFATV